MTQHSSLKASGNQKQRSVLKRIERIKSLITKKLWGNNESSVYGLPKVKTLKIKSAKKKAAPEEKAQEGESAETK